MDILQKLEKLCILLKTDEIKNEITSAHIAGVRIFKTFSELELLHGINAIESAIKRAAVIRKSEPIGTVGIIAPYNTPGFALGYGCELLVEGNKIEIYFSNDLITYRKVIDRIVHAAGLENEIHVYMGSQRDFGRHVMADLNGLQIYGGDSPFVFDYAKNLLSICREMNKQFVYCFEGPGNDPAIIFESAKSLVQESVPVNLSQLKEMLNVPEDYQFLSKEFAIQYLALNAVLGTIVGRGQSCMAFRRIIIRDSLYSTLKPEIIQLVKFINTFPESGKTQQSIIGPIGSESTNKKLFARTLGYERDNEYFPGQIDDALTHGANIWLPDGGQTTDKDEFISKCVDINTGLMRPFVISEVKKNSRLNLEETFLPIISLVKVQSDLAALDFATRGQYCLRASIFCHPDDANKNHMIHILRAHFGIIDENQPFFTAWQADADWGPGKFNNRSGFVKVFSSKGRQVEILGPRKMYRVFSKQYIKETLSENQ